MSATARGAARPVQTLFSMTTAEAAGCSTGTAGRRATRPPQTLARDALAEMRPHPATPAPPALSRRPCSSPWRLWCSQVIPSPILSLIGTVTFPTLPAYILLFGAHPGYRNDWLTQMRAAARVGADSPLPFGVPPMLLPAARPTGACASS